MKRYLPTIFMALLISVLWGYFADLQHGEVGFFVCRVVIVPIIAVALTALLDRLKKQPS